MNQNVAPNIAVIGLPGVNCEPETVRALEASGLHGHVVRWTAPNLDGVDGVVLPGGFSYQDRVRGGAIAASEPIIDAVVEAAAAGKPVLGICNGAQVLIEAGLVPGRQPGRVEMALAPNRMPDRSGYFCTWTHLRIENAETAATCALEPGEVVPMPIAHAEGRFVTRDPQVRAALASGQLTARYCQPDGSDARGFPDNPNGALLDAAAISNPAGNVVAWMPHPERAALLYQVMPELPGPWGDRRRAARDLEALTLPGPGTAVFRSLSAWLAGRQRTATAREGARAHG
jgi:phosphoribosylformylglycinamidine synthase